MTTLDYVFHIDGDEIHAVVLRQSSKLRWNAFLWGGGLRLSNSFARHEGAEKWLDKLLSHYFPRIARPLPSH